MGDIVRRFRDSLPADKKRLIVLGFITVAIPLTVILALTQQDFYKRASGLPATPATPPNTDKNPIVIGTPNVFLSAEDFYIMVNGKRYVANAEDIISESNPINPDEVDLKATWIENGEEMMLYASFIRDSINRKRWNISTFATYDGTGLKDRWLYYSGNESWGNFGNYGYSAFWDKIELQSNEKDENQNPLGVLYFDNVTIHPFLNAVPSITPSLTPSPTLTPTPTPSDTPIPTPTSQPSPSPTPAPIPGDFDGNGAADIIDFNIWRDEFLGRSTENKSDANKDGKLDLVDYIIWRNHY